MTPFDTLRREIPFSEIAALPGVARGDQPSTRLDFTEPDEIGQGL